MFQSSLYLRGMESHHSIRKQLRATDTFIAPKMQTRNRYSSNSTSYPVCQYPPCEELVKQINYSHQPEFRWVNNDCWNLRSSNTYATKPLLFWQILTLRIDRRMNAWLINFQDRNKPVGNILAGYIKQGYLSKSSVNSSLLRLKLFWTEVTQSAFFTFIQSRIASTCHCVTYVMVSTCMYNWPFILLLYLNQSRSGK